MTDKERDLARAAQNLLDQAAHDLDARTLSRLRHARAEAWRRAEHGARGQWRILAGGAALAGVVIAVAASLWLAPSPPRPPALAAVEDVDLLIAQEGPDFYRDLDFYQWVAAHEAG